MEFPSITQTAKYRKIYPKTIVKYLNTNKFSIFYLFKTRADSSTLDP